MVPSQSSLHEETLDVDDLEMLTFQLQLARGIGLMDGFFNIWKKPLMKNHDLRRAFFEHYSREYLPYVKKKIAQSTIYADFWKNLREEKEYLQVACCLPENLELEDDAWVRLIDLSRLFDIKHSFHEIQEFSGDLLFYGILFILEKAASYEEKVIKGEFRLTRGEASYETTLKLESRLVPYYISLAGEHELNIIHSSGLSMANDEALTRLVRLCAHAGIRSKRMEIVEDTDVSIGSHFLVHSEIYDIILVKDRDVERDPLLNRYVSLVANSKKLHKHFNDEWTRKLGKTILVEEAT